MLEHLAIFLLLHVQQEDSFQTFHWILEQFALASSPGPFLAFEC